MKRDNINYLMVGGTVLAGFILLLYVLFRLTGGVGERDPYQVYYSSVVGLKTGTPVTYEGYRVGAVAAITPERREGRLQYRVDLRVRDGWQIPADSIAGIYSEGLLAETVINIEEGASAEFLQPGAELRGRQGVDLFSALAAVADDVGGLTRDSVRPLLDNLNNRITSLGDQVGERLPVILDGMQGLVASLQDSASRLNRILDGDREQQLVRVIDNTDQMSVNMLQLSEGLLELQQEAHELLQVSQGMVEGNREDLDQSVQSLRRTLEDVASYTETILHNLEGTSRNMNEFSRQIRQNPGLLLGGKPPREQGVVHD
jgi:phospholipid/cholesterol/gamma-HCH transport system substrate-binding protein